MDTTSSIMVAELADFAAEMGAAGGPELDGAFTLDDESRLWYVSAGMVDLFATEGDGGRWQFLCRVSTGAVLCGAPPGLGVVLIGKPLPGGRVRAGSLTEALTTARGGTPPPPIPGQARRAEAVPGFGPPPEMPSGFGPPPEMAPAPPERAPRPSPMHPLLARFVELLAGGLDSGFGALAEAVRGGLPPRDAVELGPGERAEIRPGGAVRPARGTLWLRAAAGGVRFAGAAEDAPDLPGRVAVGESDWLVCPDGATVEAVRTRDILREDGFAAELALVRRLAVRRIAERLAGNRSSVSLQMRASRSVDAAAQQRSSRALASALDPYRQPGAAPEQADRDAYSAVARVVAEAAGIALRTSAAAEVSDERLDPLERIAVASGFRLREVHLDGPWWRTDIGPMVGAVRTESEEEPARPVALVFRRGRYQAIGPDGSRTRLDRTSAGRLAPAAWTFYRPLPERPVGHRGLLGFGLRGGARDGVVLVLCGLASALLGLLVPVLTGRVLGTLVPRAERGPVVQLCVALGASALLAAVLSAVQNLSLLRLEGRFEALAQAAVWDRLLRLPARFFAGRSTGELSNSALGISIIREILSGVSSQAVLGTLVFLTDLALLFVYDVPLALAAAGAALVGIAVTAVAGRRQLQRQREATDHDHVLAGKLFQLLSGLPKLRTAAAEDRAFAYWALGFVRSRRLSAAARRMQNVVNVFNAGFLPAGTLMLFGLLSGPAEGELSTGDFLAFNAAFGLMLSAAVQVTGAATAAAAAVPLFEGVREVTAELPEVLADKEAPGDLSGAIEVDRLSYRYGEDRPAVLQRVSLRVDPGEFVAVTGPTGCGKSTLLRMLVGFDRPTCGAVRYDGQDLASLDVAAVRRQCGVVLQNGQLFAGSILSNICGMRNFTLDEAWEAAEMAGIDHDIAALPMGMHTVLSDGASTLSAGQRQRLMIARALIGRPRILYFDEATSALDNRTQEIVAQSTRRLNATRIVIAHRLSTVMQADRIVVLDAGRIVQVGTPAELLAIRHGLFHRLARRQLT